MYAIEDIKQLREQTGLSIKDIKEALVESKGDKTQALELLKRRGIEIMKKRAKKEAKQGLVEGYVHQERVGVLVEVNCETDFVARNPDFKAFVHNLALQISAMAPEDISELLEQEYIIEPPKKIADLLNEITAKLSEKIVISRFVRMELGNK